ncbi:hypothetical protein QBC44DRAFT_316530 [Cladorrhinum sp. PSN332]|nr:hypothetical protein QBC44DRAFT_316530 [Cladorrhinum sp. PSN332]
MRQQKNEFVRIEKHSRGVRKTRYRTIVIEGDSDTSHYSGYSQAGHGQYYQTTTPNGWTGGAFMSGAIPPPWNSQQQQPPYIGPLPTPHVITVEHQPPHIVEIHPPPETREPVPSTQQRRKTSYKVITRDQPRSRSRSRSRSPSPRRAASRRAPSRRETSTSRRPDAARGRSPSQKPPPSRSDDRVSAASIRQASSSSRVPSQSRTHARPPPSNPSRSRPHSTTSNYRAQPPIPALPPGPPPISIHAITASSRQDRERELQYQSTSSRRPSSSSRPPSSYRAPSSSSRQPSSRASSTQRTEDSGYVSNSTSRASHRRAERERESAGEPAGARSSKYPPTSGRWVRAAAPKKEGGGTNSRSSRGSSRDSGVGSETGDRESERGDRGKKREVSIEFERRRPPSKGEGKRVVDDRRGRR